MRRWVTVLCALALVLSLGAAGHATELSLSSPHVPSLATAERCAPAELDVSGTAGSTKLTVSGVPPACGGLPLEVWLHDGGDVGQVAVETPVGGGQTTLTSPLTLSTRTAALATIDTWPLPTTAHITKLPFVTCRTPDDPAAGCDVEVVFRFDWAAGHGPLSNWERRLEISSDSPEPVRWEVTFNLSADSIPVQPTNLLYDDQGGLVLVSTSGCAAEPRTVTVQGRSEGWGNYHEVGGDRPTVGAGVQGQASASGAPTGADLLRCP